MPQCVAMLKAYIASYLQGADLALCVDGGGCDLLYGCKLAPLTATMPSRAHEVLMDVKERFSHENGRSSRNLS